MSRKKIIASAAATVIFIALIVFTIIWFNKTFSSNMDNERENQLNELAIQVSDTFSAALSFNQSYAISARRIFEEGEYASVDDVLSAAGEISGTLDLEEGSILIFVDDNGYCYDKEGRKGIWGDFDQISGGSDSYTFVADSVNYEGVHWAFVEKLASPVVTDDDDVEICYVALLCPVENLDGYYISPSYDNVGETYILKENGTRMYDSIEESDTISAYNVYKALRASEAGYGDLFDGVLEKLEKENTASGIYVKDGQKYCYSLTWHRENQTVILYLIPADMVAVDTSKMVSSMTRILIYIAAVLIVLLGTIVYIVTKTNNERKLNEQKEQNIKKLEEMNESLNNANKAAQSALAVAESANRAKSSFLSNMSHDIRTPLNAILGFQKLLDVSSDKPDRVKEYSDKIALAGNHLLALINDILDMSRIESGKTTLNLAPFDLMKPIEDVKALMTTQTHNKNQKLTIDNRVGSLMIVGDQARLNQILTNLLSNAVKYTPDGGTVWFITERINTSKKKIATIRFVVKDNGVGMDEEFQKRVFEPFTREENTLINGISGTGLGMSITKNLVDLMGGIIMVDSVKGEGSTFTVEISFLLAEAGETADDNTADSGNDLKGVLLGCHFLMAEDTEINAEILTELLGMEGASCDVASNGREAVKMFEASKEGSYTAILMDVQMPVMDGYEATRHIRRSNHPQAATIPIAALTANAFAEDVQKAIEAGMNTHIAKPIDMNKLKEFVASIKG